MKSICAVFLMFFCAATVSAVPVPILMYHDFAEETKDYTITAAVFRSHLEMFRREGYTTVSFEDVLRYQSGEDNLPQKPILLLSDDGYMGVLDYALPLLREYGMKMSVAVIGDMLGERGEGTLTHFTLSEKTLADPDGRIELVSHSHGLHQITDSMKGATILTLNGDFYRDIVTEDCRVMQSLALNDFPMINSVFVYPYGAYTAESEAVLGEMGYSVTVTTDKGIAEVSHGGGLRLLPRITAEWFLSGDALLKEIMRY